MESQLTPGAPGAVLDYSRSTPGALPEHSRAVQETAGARNHVTQPNYTVPTKTHPALQNLTPALRLLRFKVYHQVHQTVQVMTLQVSCNLCVSHYHKDIWPIRTVTRKSLLSCWGSGKEKSPGSSRMNQITVIFWQLDMTTSNP